MHYNEFKMRYLIDHEEFCFIYKDYKIEFVCEGSCYPIVVVKDNVIKHYEYKTPTIALKNFRIEGKSIKDIWNNLE